MIDETKQMNQSWNQANESELKPNINAETKQMNECYKHHCWEEANEW